MIGQKITNNELTKLGIWWLEMPSDFPFYNQLTHFYPVKQSVGRFYFVTCHYNDLFY